MSDTARHRSLGAWLRTREQYEFTNRSIVVLILLAGAGATTLLHIALGLVL